MTHLIYSRIIGYKPVKMKSLWHLPVAFSTFLFLVFFPSLFTNQSVYHASDYTQDLKKVLSRAKNFEDIFGFVREINLKVDLIGEITQLEAAANGNLLVVDRLAQKTWLFDREGNLLKDITAENDYPGIKWLPMGGWLGQNQTILIQIDGTHNLFLFDSIGNYVKPIPTYFPPQYRDFVISDQGYIYGYSTAGGHELTVKKLDAQGKVRATGGIFPKQFENFLSRFSEGGLVIDKNGNIYQYNACGPEIYKLSAELELLQVFDKFPPYYKRLAEDFPDFAGDPVAFMKKASQLLRQSTPTHKVHLLQESLLVVQYMEFGVKNGIYLSIYDLNGQCYILHKIAYGTPILAVRGDFIYKAFQPDEENADGELLNPVIQEYKFRYE